MAKKRKPMKKPEKAKIKPKRIKSKGEVQRAKILAARKKKKK